MDLLQAVRIINEELPPLFCDNFIIISDVAAVFEAKERRKSEKKQELLRAIKTIDELKIDEAYCFDKEFQSNHPILGDLKDNIFFEKPLFESIRVGMKEPQYTTALGWFLHQDQTACRLFIETLRESVKFPASFLFPAEDTRIESIWEYSGKKETSSEVDVGDDVRNRKEIDNLLIWEWNGKKYGIVIEIKFGAELHNELPCYQISALKEMGEKPYQKKDKKCCVFPKKELKCEECRQNASLVCIVLSVNRISPQKIEENNGCRKIWQRVLWRHFMPKLSKKMVQYQGNDDYRRFLSSLWRKVFETER